MNLHPTAAGKAETFTIQSLLIPKDEHPKLLYFRDDEVVFTATPEQEHIKFAAGQRISTNTYFNSLYLDYWRQNTCVAKIGLKITFRGEIVLSSMGVDDDENEGDTHIPLESTTLVSPRPGEEFSTVVWLHDIGAESLADNAYCRLYVNITALCDSEISVLKFVTDKAPHQEISLSIGLCTFNREAQLTDTLKELELVQKQTTKICDIYIVNQGAKFTNPDILALVEAPHINYIEQPNLGGCGGFNRTMLEAAYHDNAATHHLLMDDDIIIDGRIILRSLQFLGYATSNIVIGGQMLELENPEKLIEAGAKLDYFWVLMSIGNQLNLSEANALSLFNKNTDIDYNAWWYCMIPTDAIRQVGLSPPLFIRGDDIEYGCRLKTAGIQTISLPGVGVWHESFAFKNNDWLQYYGLRNRLIVSTMHPEYSVQPDALYILGYVFNFLLSHRYRSAGMSILGVQDFLAGPKVALQPSAKDKHEGILKHMKTMLKAPVFQELDITPFEKRYYTPIPIGIGITIQIFIANFLRLSVPRFKKQKTVVFQDGGAHPNAIGTDEYYLPNNVHKSEHVFFKPNRLALWKGTIEAVVLSIKYHFKRKRITKEWLDAFADMKTREVWEKIFSEVDE
jgi:galactofuranosylgalactofuranosylrhamnosyl-N-acetylglucosaminyl-diphospho-decaprenol beta-1,5/1,6-galactofuranosyltransferase